MVQTISSFEGVDDEQGEIKFDEIRQSSSSLYNEKQENSPECLAKNLFFNMLSRDRRASISRPYFSKISRDQRASISRPYFSKISRDRRASISRPYFNMLSRDQRASISRPYFHHWRSTRDNSRFSPKNFLAFSPRLGRGADDSDEESVHHLNKRQIEEEKNTPDLDTFLLTLNNLLQKKKIDVIYEDATKICLSEPVTDALIKEVFDKFEANRRQQEEEVAALAREQQSKGKHPLLFRYRLG